MQGPFPIEIFEGRDFVIIKLEYFELVRIVFMNESEHPADWPHSQTGHSIGHWQGDTLVVDTRSLSPGTLFNNGVGHSEDIHLIERFRLADADTLVIRSGFWSMRNCIASRPEPSADGPTGFAAADSSPASSGRPRRSFPPHPLHLGAVAAHLEIAHDRIDVGLVGVRLAGQPP